MKIGYLYKDTSKYSEGFIWNEIKVLKELGFDVLVFAKSHKTTTTLPVDCKVVTSYRISSIFSINAIVCAAAILIKAFKPAWRLFFLERKRGSSPIKALKKVYYAAHILPYKLDYLVYTFFPLVENRESVADAIGAQRVICLRGYDTSFRASLFKKTDKLFVRSEDLYRFGLKNGLDPEISNMIVPSAVNLEDIIYQPIKYNRSEPLKILAVGRAHWKKGYEYLLCALKILLQLEINFKCEIIAAGVEKEKLIYMVNILGLTSYVSFLGEIPQHRVIKYLYTADLLIHSSISEGCSNILLEAQAAGLFCIASNIPGNNIVHGETGLLFDVCDSESLACQVKSFLVLTNKERSDILKNARKNIERKFSLSVLSANLLHFYKH